MKAKPRAAWTQKALVVILGGAVVTSAAAVAQQSSSYAFFDPLIDVKSMVDRLYVSEVDEEALREGAIRGMLEVLGDPYTQYVPPSDSQAFSEAISGEYVGIGAEVTLQDGWLTIVTPLDDSPAFKAGVMADDRVVAVDGESTEGEAIDAAIARMKGEPGTPVVLTIERGGKTLDVTVVRDHVKQRAVRGFQRSPSGDGAWEHVIDPERKVGYIRLSQFTGDATEEIEQALDQLGADEGELGGLVIDLRWNPGGLLSEAIEIADLFLESGPIVSTRTGGGAEQVAKATAAGTIPPLPIAVLINGQSASASEILAGALTENPSAKLPDGDPMAVTVGTRTFGKGSVQSIMPLESQPGAVLKITQQKYYLPSGRSLHRLDDSTEWGVDPASGFLVQMTPDETREMLSVRRELSVIRTEGQGAGSAAGDAPEAKAVWSDPSRILEELKDPQLAAAVRAVQQRIDTGDWVPQTEAEPGVDASQVAELAQAQNVRERLLRELDRLDRRIAAISEGVSEASQDAGFDLWADDAPIAGGSVVVTDAEGREVARLKIVNDQLERWLIDAGVEKAEEPSSN